MVVQDEPSRDTVSAHQLAVLRHCVDVLRSRVRDDAVNTWNWRVRLKAALYCLRTLEGQRRLGPIAALDSDEIQDVEETHPLLRTDRITSSILESRDQTEWYRELQERVRQFARRDWH